MILILGPPEYFILREAEENNIDPRPLGKFVLLTNSESFPLFKHWQERYLHTLPGGHQGGSRAVGFGVMKGDTGFLGSGTCGVDSCAKNHGASGDIGTTLSRNSSAGKNDVATEGQRHY